MKEVYLWAFWANTNGPWWKSPQKVKRNISYYYHKNGNASIEREGLVISSGHLAFADKDKKEVQKFIDGFMACRKLMAGFYVD